MPLSADDLTRAFAGLSEELGRRNQHGRMIVAGGAALVLLFPERGSAEAVDAYFIQPEAAEMLDAAQAVARRLDLPQDWLNERAKPYFLGMTLGDSLYESEHLEVRAATHAQLLAMKLVVWRDEKDRNDARMLLEDMDGTREEIWGRVGMLVPEGLRERALERFEELWKAVAGDLRETDPE